MKEDLLDGKQRKQVVQVGFTASQLNQLNVRTRQEALSISSLLLYEHNKGPATQCLLAISKAYRQNEVSEIEGKIDIMIGFR